MEDRELAALLEGLAREPEDEAGWARLVRGLGRQARPPDLSLLPDLLAAWRRRPGERHLGDAVLPLLGLEAHPEGLGPPGDWWGDAGFDPESGLPLVVRRAADRAEMLLLPEAPLPRFYVDRHPVAVGQYMRFLEATGHRPPAYWVPQLIRPHRPVVFVSWGDAAAYAAWAGAQLPTWFEWERAGRTEAEQNYPWGEEEPTPARANLNHAGRRNPEVGLLGGWETSLKDVGVHPDGVSPFGVHDLCGQVWEWLDEEPDEGEHACAGGSWNSTRGAFEEVSYDGRDGTARTGEVGFRLIRRLSPDAEPPERPVRDEEMRRRV